MTGRAIVPVILPRDDSENRQTLAHPSGLDPDG
jgi:hypothetical protein